MGGEKKEKSPGAEKFFKEAGSLWVSLYGELMPCDEETGEVADCGFWEDGSEKKAMKEILISLRGRAERQNVVWTKEEMSVRLNKFIRAAKEDSWISEHFSLRIINQSKTLIFNKLVKSKNEKDGKSNSEGGGKQRGSFKTAGQEAFADRLRDRLKKLQ